jgi:integrase
MPRSGAKLRSVNLTARKRQHTYVYEARIYVPKRLQGRLGRREIVFCLRTAHRMEAERRLSAVKTTYFELFDLCDRCPELPAEALLDLARRHLQKSNYLSQENYAATSLTWASACPPDYSPGQMLAADFDAAERDIGKAIADRRFGSVRQTGDEILRSEAHTLSEGKRQLFDLMLLQARQQNASFTAHLFRSGLGGALTWSPSDRLFQTEQRSAAMTVVRDNAAQIEHITLSEAVARFIEEKQGAIGPSGITKHTNHLKVAASYFGSDTLVGTISKPQVWAFRELLTKLPANFSKRYPDRSLTEIVALPLAERQPLLKPSARGPYVGSLSCLFKFCVRMGSATANPATDMRFDDPEDARDKRHPFSRDQLELIFSQPEFTGRDGCHRAQPGTTLERGTHFWTPIIAFFSGMRRGEIFALTPERIIERDGQYYFDVQRAKTNSGIRKVPLHPHLLKLGFLDFVASVPAGSLLFADMSGDAMGKAFARLLQGAGIKTKKLTFHSFRHSFIDALRAVQVPDTIMKTIVGHKGPSVTENYGLGYPPHVLTEHVVRADFWGLGLDHLVRHS